MIKNEITKKYITDPKGNTVYVNFKSGKLFLQCPNKKCKQRVVLPLKNANQTWSINSKGIFNKKIKGPITIYPSIHSKTHKEQCHYWIKNGKVQWVFE